MAPDPIWVRHFTRRRNGSGLKSEGKRWSGVGTVACVCVCVCCDHFVVSCYQDDNVPVNIERTLCMGTQASVLANCDDMDCGGD